MSDEWRSLLDNKIQDAGRLFEGKRLGRFVFLRDLDGRTHAVSASAVGAMCETDEGTALILSGGRILQVPQSIEIIVAWLDGRGPT